MGDFVERVATIFRNQKEINKDIQQIICQIMQSSFKFVKEMYNNLQSGSQQSKYFYNNKATEMFYDFSKKYRIAFKEIGKKIFTRKSDLNSKVAIFTAIKNLERNADHAFNIIENFVYISNPDLYFTKESRKR